MNTIMNDFSASSPASMSLPFTGRAEAALEGLYLRRIVPDDDERVAQIVRQVLQEFGCGNQPGWASEDPELCSLSTVYKGPDACYWVLSDASGKTLYGGGGFARLKGTVPEEAICELQKVYFLPHVRGHGWGRLLLNQAMAEARKLGYDWMYAETVPELTSEPLLHKAGFMNLPAPMGNTGHFRCTRWLLKSLQSPLF
jgi:putative acetyltransferase